MIVETNFRVAAPADRVWAELTDLGALAACLPGSALERVNGDATLQGALRPQIGAGAIDCIGVLKPLDIDEDGRRASCRLRVREAAGPGFATGTLRGSVSGSGDSAEVAVSLDGRVAAPGVSEESARPEAERLLRDLAQTLEKSLAERASRPAPSSAHPEPEPASRPSSPPRKAAPSPAAEPDAATSRVPAAAGAGVAAAAVVLGLVAAGRRRRRGVRFEIRYKW